MTIDYKNSKVYKIWSPNGDKIYVGSTTKKMLCQRMTAHREDFKRWKAGNFHSVSSFLLFEEYGVENCFIELIEAKECNSKDELHKLEGKYIRELNCVNKVVPGRTKKEYYKDNLDHIVEYNNKWREDNKEIIKANKSTPLTCECGSTYRIHHKARHGRSIKHKLFLEKPIEN